MYDFMYEWIIALTDNNLYQPIRYHSWMGIINIDRHDKATSLFTHFPFVLIVWMPPSISQFNNKFSLFLHWNIFSWICWLNYMSKAACRLKCYMTIKLFVFNWVICLWPRAQEVFESGRADQMSTDSEPCRGRGREGEVCTVNWLTLCVQSQSLWFCFWLTWPNLNFLHDY